MRAEKRKRRISRTSLAVILLAVLVIAGGAAAFAAFGGKSKPVAVNKPVPPPPPTNPLTGQILTKPLPARPIIVSTDNVGPARPQWGISKADVVYEFPVEGNQSRLEPIYYSKMPKQIGPVRSARPYFVDLAREYKAVFVHFGWSPAARHYLQTNVVPYISAFSHGDLFHRTTEKPAPHNAYTSAKELWGFIKKQKGWDQKQDVPGFQFLKPGETVAEAVAATTPTTAATTPTTAASATEASTAANPAPAPATVINTNYETLKNQYKYNPKTGLYKRYTEGAPYIDLTTGKQITTSNILVQKVKSKVLDYKGRLKINMTAGGKALLFTQGVVVKGTWSRANLDSPTIFTDSQGNQFKLSVGTTWVEVLDQTCTVNYK